MILIVDSYRWFISLIHIVDSERLTMWLNCIYFHDNIYIVFVVYAPKLYRTEYELISYDSI